MTRLKIKLFLLFNIFLIFFLSFTSQVLLAKMKVTNFIEAKRYLNQHLDLFEFRTIYCGCKVKGKQIDLNSCLYQSQSDLFRARRLEWEHVVPAEAFGNSFIEWREGSPNCHKGKRPFKGRKCAETNSEFRKMEADLYNLFPEIGELNGLRSNFSMAALTESSYDFGGCKAKIFERKFEPMDFAKGVVARTYLNFDQRYPDRGVVSNKNQKLFEAWDKLFPVNELECKRWQTIEKTQGYSHRFIERCAKVKIQK